MWNKLEVDLSCLKLKKLLKQYKSDYAHETEKFFQNKTQKFVKR